MSGVQQRLATSILSLAALVLLSTPHPSPAQDAKLRIAMIPQGTNTQVQALADLLMADLSSGNHWELVEREQLDRVFKEQGLAGLQGTNRIALGKLLRADGLVFLAWHATKEQLRINVVEARQGFQVGAVAYRVKPDAIAGLSDTARTDIERMLGKLTTDPSKRVLVSVLRIANATLRPEYLWLEDEVPRLIGECLGMDPRVLVLERRQLDHLMGEVEISADALAAFRGAGVILDGEIGVRKGVAFDPKAPPVSFTVRMLGPDLAEQAVVSVDGTLDKVEELVSRGCIEVAKRFNVDAVSGTAGLESKLFLEVAKKHGLLWAAESARALDASDTNAMKALAIQLIKDNLYANGTPGAPQPKPTLEKARNLARAADLYLALGNDPEIQHFLFNEKKETLQRLSTSEIIVQSKQSIRCLYACEFTNEENIRDILLPLRRLCLYAFNRNFTPNIEISPAFFDNISDLQSYWRSVLRGLLDNSTIERNQLMHVMAAMERVALQTQGKHGHPSTWPYWQLQNLANKRQWMSFFNSLAHHTNEVVSFFACDSMRSMTEHLEEKNWARNVVLAGDRMLARLPNETLAFERQANGIFRAPYISAMLRTKADPSKLLHWLLDPFDGFTQSSDPNLNQPYSEHLNHLLLFATSKDKETLPDHDQKRLVEQIFKAPPHILQHAIRRHENLPPLQARLDALHKLLTNAPTPRTDKVPTKPEPGMLFSSQHPKWIELLSGLHATDPASIASIQPYYSPGCMLLKGNRLIAAFGSSSETTTRIALFILDIGTGNVIAQWGKQFTRTPAPLPAQGKMPRQYEDEYFSMTMGTNQLYVAFPKVGIMSCPVTFEGINDGKVDFLDATILPDPNCRYLTLIGDELFIASSVSITKWNCKTRDISFVANFASNFKELDIPTNSAIRLISSDNGGTQLFVLFNNFYQNPNRKHHITRLQNFSLACYNNNTTSWKIITPKLIPDDSPVLTCMATVDGNHTIVVATNRKDGDFYEHYYTYYIFNPNNMKLECKVGSDIHPDILPGNTKLFQLQDKGYVYLENIHYQNIFKINSTPSLQAPTKAE